jgi:hypothetical protein
MPFDSLLVSTAVTAVFVLFAAVLAWANFQKAPAQEPPAGRTTKRS